MKQIIGKKAILERCPEILTDESRYTSGVPNEVLFPENIHDLQEIMRRATKENIHVTFSGGRTGITGGAVPENNDIVVSFSAMKNIVKCEIDSSGTPILYCEPGITLESIASFLNNPDKWHTIVPGHELLCNKSFIYFPDPTELTAQLGGTVATNASGARSFHFGPTRNHIDYLEIVLASGELISLKRGSDVQESWNMLSKKINCKLEPPTYSYAKVKNASGFYTSPKLDPIDLFIGSEGTLGAICTIGIKLAPKPTFLSGLTFFRSRTQAFDFADFLRENPNVASIEYFDESVFDIFTNSEIRSSGALPTIPLATRCAVYWEFIESNQPFENEMELWEKELNRLETSFDNTWSGFDPSESQKLKMLRHAVPEFVNTLVANNKRKCPNVRKISTDSSIPKQYFREWFQYCIEHLEQEKIQYVAFGHLGDFHLHINMLPSTEKQLDTALALYHDFMFNSCKKGGSISAEHGVGKLKRDLLSYMYDSSAVNQMKKIKKALDPNSLLNNKTLFSLT